MLENGKHPQEINLLQLSLGPNSIAMAGWGEWASPDWKIEWKALRQPLPSFLWHRVPALTEALKRKVDFTNGCVSHSDRFFLLCDCWILSWRCVQQSVRAAFVWVLSGMNSGREDTGDKINTPYKAAYWLGAFVVLPKKNTV